MKSLQLALTALCLLSALWLVVLIIRDRTPDRFVLNALAVVEVGLLVNMVLGIVRVTSEANDVAAWEYVAYLVGATLILPAGVVWSLGERTRGGTAVLLAAALLVPFMFVRLSDIWAGVA
ncbi:MAG: hypothetical protein ABIN79_01815 [Marmoricola sp.]